jgi:hypothetical protein
LNKYINLAKEYNMLNTVIISPENIYFDIRAILKCRWGCEDYFKESIKCHSRNTTYLERVEMIKKSGTGSGLRAGSLCRASGDSRSIGSSGLCHETGRKKEFVNRIQVYELFRVK